PLLLIAPLAAIGHGFETDVAYTLVLGIASLAAFVWMVREAAETLGLDISDARFVWMLLLFAFASPNFYLSMQGRIWHTSQIGATLYALLALALTFRFINRQRFFDIALAIVCFALACDARMTFLALGPVPLYALVVAYRRDPRLASRVIAFG